MTTAAAGGQQPLHQDHDGVDHGTNPPRLQTSTDEIDHTITRPGSVKINVTGAFIVDPDTATPALSNGGRLSPTHHETSDIRLPNHTAVVSHIAIDVCVHRPLLFYPSSADNECADWRLAD